MFNDLHRALVVAAHPDDEMLGCGGTLARLRAAGVDISVLLLGEGPTARSGSEDEDSRSRAHHSALAAAHTIGITDVRFAALPDNQFDTLPLLEIIKRIERVATEVHPELVFTHHAGDLNQDHRLTHQATLTAFRPLPGEQSAAIVLGFEVLSSTEYTPAQTAPAFTPTVFVDITDYLDTKLAALHAYSSEMRPWPHPRSYEGTEYLARTRGAQCGRAAAEAFMLYRGVF